MTAYVSRLPIKTITTNLWRSGSEYHLYKPYSCPKNCQAFAGNKKLPQSWEPFVGIARYLREKRISSPVLHLVRLPIWGSWYTRKPVVAFHRYPLSFRTNPPHKADDGLSSQPSFRAEARKYQLSLFIDQYSKRVKNCALMYCLLHFLYSLIKVTT